MTKKTHMETVKTALFVAAAASASILAFATRPAPVGIEPDEQVGEPLFAEFTDPLTATGLEIVSYDEELGQITTFKVLQEQEGIWVIPSHQSYPADAEDRLAESATMFVDLKVISVVSEAEGTHEEYGVVEPDAEKTSLGDQGVGTFVTVYGKGNTKLAELIIGKAVPHQSRQRFARLPGKARVYQLQIDPSRLSTKFSDWIDTDLLRLNVFDVDSITVRDYSLGQGVIEERMVITVREQAGTWQVDQFTEFLDGQMVPTSLADGEELNQQRLNTLRDSLDDLRIVNVQRKPKALEADLIADGQSPLDDESLTSLAQRGFHLPRGGGELLSSNGEVLINTKDGVTYLLRFGNIAGVEKNSTDSSTGGLNRFLFVAARVNEALFPMPEMDRSITEGVGEGATDDQVARAKRLYQRKLDQRDENLAKAKRKVADLNYRFADWYYIIPEDFFRKVRLGRSGIITFVGDDTGIRAFRQLEREGLLPATD